MLDKQEVQNTNTVHIVLTRYFKIKDPDGLKNQGQNIINLMMDVEFILTGKINKLVLSEIYTKKVTLIDSLRKRIYTDQFVAINQQVQNIYYKI